jgi:hypothetical protein
MGVRDLMTRSEKGINEGAAPCQISVLLKKEGNNDQDLLVAITNSSACRCVKRSNSSILCRILRLVGP